LTNLGGSIFLQWNSSTDVKVRKSGNQWQAEMIIPFAGLDVFSNPGWKWTSTSATAVFR
jgi:hypothetical protein